MTEERAPNRLIYYIFQVVVILQLAYGFTRFFLQKHGYWQNEFEIKIMDKSSEFNSLVHVPETDFILSGSFSRNIQMWNVTSGQFIRNFTVSPLVKTLISIPETEQIISGGMDTNIQVWNMKSGQLSKTLKGHTSTITSLVHIPNTTYIFSGSWDGTIRMWDTGFWFRNNIKTFNLPNSTRVFSLIYIPNTSTIISASEDKKLTIWDFHKGHMVRHLGLFSQDYPVTSLLHIPDTNTIVSGSLRDIKLWDLHTDRCLKTFRGHKHFVSKLIHIPNTSFIISSSYDKTLRMWNINKRQHLKTFMGHEDIVNDVVYLEKTNSIVSASPDGSIRSWNLDIYVKQEKEL